jgi:hypothetical protein
MDLDGGDMEEVPLFNMAASQEYRHEYSGHRRQKVFNDSVHGEISRGSQHLQTFTAHLACSRCNRMGLRKKAHDSSLQDTFSCTEQVWPSLTRQSSSASAT